MTVRGSDLSILIIVPVTLVALTWFFDRTTLGSTVKACASNPRLARLSGISPKVISTMVWALAAGLSTLSVVLIAGQTGSAGDVTTLGPQTLSLALVAAVIGGMTSFSRAIIASVAIGLAESILNFNFIADPGLINLLLLDHGAGGRPVQPGTSRRERGLRVHSTGPPMPVRLQSYRWARNVNKSGIVLLGVIAVVLPLVFTTPSTQQIFTEVVAFAICATSLTVLTGWLGQLSLGQMAFAGLGALFAARLVEVGVPFWLAIAATTAASAVLAAILGLGLAARPGPLPGRRHLHIRPGGTAVLLQPADPQRAVVGRLGPSVLPWGSSSHCRSPGSAPTTTWSSSSSPWSSWSPAGSATAEWVAPSWRCATTRTPRPPTRVRPAWEKIRAFSIAGALAGMGGALLSGAFANVAFGGPGSFFVVDGSLGLVAMVVIGGMGSVTAAVIGAIWVIGIPALAPNNQVLGLLASSLGLLVILLYFPRGLNQVSYDVRDAFLAWADRRFGKDPAPKAVREAATVLRPATEHPRDTGAPALAVTDLRVTYGGITAVDRVTLTVGSGQIVGLIGSNGAGKSTLMNAIGGFVSATGSVRLGDQEIGDKPPASRAALGLGRTFQSATLFPELTVNETLLVALESKDGTGALSTAIALPRNRRRSRTRPVRRHRPD